ncbi:Protein dispatched 1 [Nymphon striatum]|nr:Protein dispatched 1 [Nymphon striatum]
MYFRYVYITDTYPVIVIGLISFICTVLTAVSLSLNKIPEFKNPELGFESRGTELSGRLVAWENIKKSSSVNGVLKSHSTTPDVNITTKFIGTVIKQSPHIKISQKNSQLKSTRKLKHRKRFKNRKRNKHKKIVASFQSVELEKKKLKEAENVHPDDHFSNGHTHLSADGLCNSPVFQFQSLLSFESLKSMCDFDEKILRSQISFDELCYYQKKNSCCPSWSLSNYVAFLNNKTSCHEITDEDIENIKNTLKLCFKYYQKSQLAECLFQKKCDGIPLMCRKSKAIYDIFHYIIDTNSFGNNSSGKDLLYVENSMIFLPLPKSIKNEEYFYAISNNLDDGKTKIVAMDLGLREVIFDHHLIFDLIYAGIGSIFIMTLIWGYTGSLMITLVAIVSVVFSVGAAHFFYTMIYGIKLFPYLNFLTIILIIGLGVDDILIYSRLNKNFKAQCNLKDGQSSRLKIIDHAITSMFVTTITTATALFATYFNPITAVRCFSLFAGTTILLHFFIMMWCLPSVMILQEKLDVKLLKMREKCSECCFKKFSCRKDFSLSFLSMKISSFLQLLFSKYLPTIVFKIRIFWNVLFAIVLSVSIYVIFTHIHNLLPNSSHFQLLSSNHLFERYHLKFKNMFGFENDNSFMAIPMPIRIIWGVLPVDNGDYFDPFNKGDLVFDDTFNISAKSSQKFLLNLCQDLRKQSFFRPTIGFHLSDCFIETFKSWMNRSCFDEILNMNFSPCCDSASFPYEPDVFEKCLPKAVKTIHGFPGLFYTTFNPGSPGVRYSAHSNHLKAVIIEFKSIYNFTLSYHKMSKFFNAVQSWLDSSLALAPSGLKNGWFVSDLNFYTLQESLVWGTLLAAIVAAAISFILIIAMTFSLRLSIISMFSFISIITFVTTTIILMGWSFDVFQSIIVTVLIGLAVDFTIHYSIAYKYSPSKTDRKLRVTYSLSSVSSPITLSFVTTFIAGAVMLFSSVLVYFQIGTFLMLMSAMSWFVSTFFFESFLAILGPVVKPDHSSQNDVQFTLVELKKNDTPEQE